MVEPKRKKIIAIIFLLFLAGCANQLPPGGGMVDDIPPKIIEVYPKDGTINYDEDFFEMTFDEYVDKRSFKDAIFISPAIEGELEISWSGKTVTVFFPAELKQNRTYTINIGTDVVDYNNRNRMAENFSFAFSTGTNIDNGVIRGKIFTDKPSGIMLFAYLLENNADTIDITARKPDYVSQAGEKGVYNFSGLTLGKYRVFAVKDEFRDLVIDLDQDQIGIPFTDILLNAKDTLFSNLDFKLSKIDTTPPRLNSAVMTDRNHILLTFSEEVKSELLLTNNFLIVDSTTKQTILPIFAFKGRTKEKEYVLSTNEKLNSENELFIHATNIFDLNGNVNLFDYIRLTASEKSDTSAPTLYRTIPGYNSQKVDYEKAGIKIFFDDSFMIKGIEKKIVFIDTLKKEYDFEIQKLDDASFQIIPKQKLKALTPYQVKIDFGFIKDAAGNYRDSIYVYQFTTKSELDYTGISGSVTNVDLSSHPVIVLENVDDEQKYYQQNLGLNGEFSFSKIDPGKFRLYCFLDKNKNGKHDLGFPSPLVLSEEFHYHNRTIDIPPRWEVTDVIFNFISGE